MMSVTLRELIDGLKGASTSIVRARRDDTREQLTANSCRKRTDVTKLAGIRNAFPKLPVSASRTQTLLASAAKTQQNEAPRY